MNSKPHNPNASGGTQATGEDTLRLIASLPAPAGLEDSVHAALRRAPRGGRVLAWPAALRPQSGWMRTAAAAAIVFVVAGGGWGVYTRVQPGQPAKVIVMPPRMAGPGGFSGAGAMRTPQTITGPTAPASATPLAVQPKTTAKKPAGQAASKSSSTSRPDSVR
jgi:hypothetical protein